MGSGIKHATTGDGTKVTDTVWAEEHDVTAADLRNTLGLPTIPLLSAIVARIHGKATMFYHDNYYVLSQYPNEANQSPSLITLGIDFDYGTYQCKGKIDNTPAGVIQIVFGFENLHGWSSEGIMDFYFGGSVYTMRTSWAGSETTTTLAGQDWTSERTFKFIWTSTSVKGYVNGALVATHTTDISQSAMNLFCELSTTGSPPAVQTYVRTFKEFEEL